LIVHNLYFIDSNWYIYFVMLNVIQHKLLICWQQTQFATINLMTYVDK
jgi:hypothetical protein